MSEPHDHATVERERPEELAELLRPDIQNQGCCRKKPETTEKAGYRHNPTSRHGGDPPDPMFPAASVSTLGSGWVSKQSLLQHRTSQTKRERMPGI
jgi:hypothetical protein